MKILVTGGASGLGEAIAKKVSLLADSKVISTYYKSEKKAKILQDSHTNITFIKCDFSNSAELQELIALMEKEEIDVLINNVHTTSINKKHFHKLPLEVFSNGFINNVLPVIHLTQTAIGIFRKKKFGKIINILSGTLLNKPPIGYSEYTAAKAYMLSLSKSWANENAAYNITSNCVSPAFMQTTLTSDVDERVVEEMRNRHPLKKILNIDEVAEIVAFLCASSQQLNGINIPVNSAENVV